MTRRTWGALVLFGLATGCNRVPTAPPEVHAVKGKVLLGDGTPLRGGRIVFHPRGGGKEAVAEVQPDGTFRLTSFRKDDGAMPGEYAISISPYSYKTGNPVAIPQASRVPRRYWEEDTTPLMETVQAGENDVTLTIR